MLQAQEGSNLLNFAINTGILSRGHVTMNQTLCFTDVIHAKQLHHE